MDSFAVFFDWWPNVPVYHGFDNDRLNDRDEPLATDYTRCGRIVAQYNSDTRQLLEPGQWVPMKHAAKFGRRCRVCFPNSNQESRPE